jgi:hypothetical protein
MNPMKAEVKMLTVQDLGANMDDVLEGAQKEASKAEGGMEWLAKAANGLKAISQKVDRDLDTGTIEMEVARYTKKMLGLASESLNSVALQAQSQKLAAVGKAAGIEQCVKMAKKIYDTEKLKLESAILQMEKDRAQAEEAGEEPPNGSRPRSNAAADDLRARKAASRAAKKKAAKKTTKKTAKKTATRKKAPARKKR